jgi:hypothetical protein
MSKAVAILDTFKTDDAGAVVEVTFDIAGGTSHNERRDAALDALEAFTERTSRPVPVMFYEVRRYGRDLAFRFFVDTPQETPLAG